ncbi:hypothetical protein AAG570_000661 [Ranatra chinensis]|uniref:CUB domain-containing protein n=1 Tax=Ranatra chinensis TaxID=642074 RepID=A0ABD0YXP1_9HEMI
MLVSRAGGRDCGGHLTRDSGIVHTPGFPHPFRLPANCRWVIDSSSRPQGTTIVVRMTQLYVTAGLTFTEFAYYEPDSPFRLGANTLYEVTETTALAVLNVTTSQHYLVIDFKMERLAGNHIRALEGLLDVYGFNLTYNIYRGKSALHSYTPACSVAACSMLGNCYASSDFS